MDETASLLFSLIALWFSLEFIDHKKYLRLFFTSLCVYDSFVFKKENVIAYLAIIPIVCYLLYARLKLVDSCFVTLLITAFVF